MVRKLLVQILEGSGYYDDSEGNSVAVWYLSDDGSLDTELGHSGKLGDMEYISHGIWMYEFDSDELEAPRTDWFRVTYGDEISVDGFGQFNFPTTTLTYDQVTILAALANQYLGTPNQPSVPSIRTTYSGAAVTMIETLGAGELFKVYYKIGSAPASDDMFVLTDNKIANILIDGVYDSETLYIRAAKINKIGLSSALSSDVHIMLSLELTSAKVADRMVATNIASITAALANNPTFIARSNQVTPESS